MSFDIIFNPFGIIGEAGFNVVFIVIDQSMIVLGSIDRRITSLFYYILSFFKYLFAKALSKYPSPKQLPPWQGRTKDEINSRLYRLQSFYYR